MYRLSCFTSLGIILLVAAAGEEVTGSKALDFRLGESQKFVVAKVVDVAKGSSGSMAELRLVFMLVMALPMAVARLSLRFRSGEGSVI